MPATAKEALYTRINEDNGTDFNAVNTQLSAPEPFNNADISPRNTTVLLTGIPAEGKKGSVRFYYNRRTFVSLMGNSPVELEWGAQLRIHDLIPALNEQFNIQLVPDDLVDAGLPDRSEGFTSFTVVARLDSYGWLGTFAVNLQVPPDNIEDEVSDPDAGNPVG